MSFLPSPTLPGDWDLKAIIQGSWPELHRQFKRPMPSILHRIDDPRALDLLQATAAVRQEEWATPSDTTTATYSPIKPIRQHPPLRPHEDLLRQAAALAEAHPDDPTIAVLRLDALLAARDFTTLEAEIAKWRDRLERPSFLRVPFRRAELALRASKLSLAGRNAYDFLATVFDPQTGLAQRFTQLPDIQKYPDYAEPRPSIWAQNVPDFLAIQTHAKVGNVLAIFMLLAGRRDQARETLAATYHLGAARQRRRTVDLQTDRYFRAPHRLPGPGALCAQRLRRSGGGFGRSGKCWSNSTPQKAGSPSGPISSDSIPPRTGSRKWRITTPAGGCPISRRPTRASLPRTPGFRSCAWPSQRAAARWSVRRVARQPPRVRAAPPGRPARRSLQLHDPQDVTLRARDRLLQPGPRPPR